MPKNERNNAADQVPACGNGEQNWSSASLMVMVNELMPLTGETALC
jgi:hypothetical protein